jgi:pimeloyl-ACP methyl ester carboxylesterase
MNTFVHRPYLRFVVLAVALALVAGACSKGSLLTDQENATDAGGAPAVTLSWKSCGSDQPGFQCATLTVPVDYAKPAGATLDLALARKKAAQSANRIGSLLVNPGGPGASGIDFAVSLSSKLPSELSERFDLVGFDPRGIGKSSPVSCIDDATKDRVSALDSDPDTPAAEQANVTAQKAIAAGCVKKVGDALTHFGTADAARDMDRIRAALGDAKLTYAGFSYGTQLGAAYATLFPDKVRALYLDGAVDPNIDLRKGNEEQAAGFQLAFGNFAKACVAATTCPAKPDPQALYARLKARSQAAPIPVKTAGERRSLTESLLETGAVAALYDQDSWPQLADGLAQADKGDGSLLLRFADLYNDRDRNGKYSNQIEANLAVNCADETERPSLDDGRSFAAALHARYPFIGATLGWSLLGCTGWPTSPTPLPKLGSSSSPPLLIVGTTGDPATPVQGAANMAAIFSGSVSVVWQGEGHTAFGKSDCVDAAAISYLVDLKLPAKGTTCPGATATNPFASIRERQATLSQQLVDEFVAQGLTKTAAQCVADGVFRSFDDAALEELFDGSDLSAATQRQLQRIATGCGR